MGFAIDVDSFEQHNVIRKDGRMRTRTGLHLLATPTAGTEYVGGFSLESPFSSEVYHYVFEQSTTTRAVTARVVTEEFFEVANLPIGVTAARPVITYGVANNQLIINSPSFSGPLYGLIGGGLVQAVKTESDNPETRALDLPPGHVTSWGGRIAIAAANSVLVSDGRLDPRTFTSAGELSFPGVVYDLFVGPDGALYVVTSADIYVVPADALALPMLSQSFIATIPGVYTSRPRNACAAAGAVLALGRDGLVFVTRSSQERVDLSPYEGKRYWTPSVQVEDYRQCTMFPATNGVVIGFGERRVWLDVDLRTGSRSYTWASFASPELAGVLRSREGDTLYLCRDQILARAGNVDQILVGTVDIRGVACGRIDVPADTSLPLRSVTVATDAVGQGTVSYIAGVASSVAVPSGPSDIIIGTTPWLNAPTYYGRDKRTVEHAVTTRTTDIQIEIGVEGGDRILDLGDLEPRGQGRTRRSRNA